MSEWNIWNSELNMNFMVFGPINEVTRAFFLLQSTFRRIDHYSMCNEPTQINLGVRQKTFQMQKPDARILIQISNVGEVFECSYFWILEFETPFYRNRRINYIALPKLAVKFHFLEITNQSHLIFTPITTTTIGTTYGVNDSLK